MAKIKRNMGQEILDGIRQIKRGQHGRITTCHRCERRREDWPSQLKSTREITQERRPT